GTPFSVQVAPDSVASMRTLAGSRYDLVERNNNIVLDYRQKSDLTVNLPNTLSGYGAQNVPLIAMVTSSKPVKNIRWSFSQQFKANGGAIADETAKETSILLPVYQYAKDGSAGLNNYDLAVTVAGEHGKPKTAHMKVIVEPFVIKEKSIKARGKGAAVADGSPAYDLLATVTYGDKNNKPLKKDTMIPDVKWTIDPPNDDAELHWNDSQPLNEQGQLTATLGSKTPLDPKTKVYLSIAGMPKELINDTDSLLNFVNMYSEYQITDTQIKPDGTLTTNDVNNVYIFTAKILDKNGNPLQDQKINAKWQAISLQDNSNKEVEIKSIDNYKTNSDGVLTATLRSNTPQKIRVTLSLEKGAKASFNEVEFVKSDMEATFTIDGKDEKNHLTAISDKEYKVTVHLTQGGKALNNNKPLKLKWSLEPKLEEFTIKETDNTPDTGGKAHALISSTRSIEGAQIILSVDDGPLFESEKFNFVAPNSQDLGAVLEGKVEPLSSDPIRGNEKDEFIYQVKVIQKESGNALKNQSISDIKWKVNKPEKALGHFTLDVPDNSTTDNEGYLTAKLKSKEGYDNVTVSVSLGDTEKQSEPVVQFLPEAKKSVGLFVKADYNPGVQKVIPSSQPEGMRYVHEDAYLELMQTIDGKNEYLGYSRDGTKGGKYPTSSEDDWLTTVSPSNKERVIYRDSDDNMRFNTKRFMPGPITFSKTYTDKETGRKELYSYTLNPQRYVYLPETPGKTLMYVKLKDDMTCEDLPASDTFFFKAKTLVLGTDITESGSAVPNTSYNYDFNNDFKNLGIASLRKDTTRKIKIKTADGFAFYDIDKRQVVSSNDDNEGVLLCYRDGEYSGAK
ncbi:inverse autotransporter beta domain-containing protein, partial [Xenorhabdus sp. Vera]|uniref:hypothetical protein n=1 Tax=Xenorhabdus koppenhoeferi TaxID=351659 RepID=UPI0019939D12